MREVGADHVICTDTRDIVQKVHDSTNERGAHVILELMRGWKVDKALEKSC
ncbi:hypothetical protein C2W64_04620 [Brevibacillus laterosporus]|nr:hypothetical protein [Brevibacillus laterosporus]RAP28564.1 hypothetical protein C2W64_04620 [Brevibacillus laterosporus]